MHLLVSYSSWSKVESVVIACSGSVHIRRWMLMYDVVFKALVIVSFACRVCSRTNIYCWLLTPFSPLRLYQLYNSLYRRPRFAVDLLLIDRLLLLFELNSRDFVESCHHIGMTPYLIIVAFCDVHLLTIHVIWYLNTVRTSYMLSYCSTLTRVVVFSIHYCPRLAA